MTNIFIAYSIVSSLFLPTLFTTPITETRTVNFGLFSQDKEDYKINSMSIIHEFTVWGPNFKKKNQDYIKTFNTLGEASRKVNRNKPKTPLITLEPWPLLGEDTNREQLLRNIAIGEYDFAIKEFCYTIQKNSFYTVTVRWGHEMEMGNNSRYPWALDNPELYISAYRRWVDTCKSVTRKVKYMWAPAGLAGQEKFYPGNSYADFVGFGMYSYPAYDIYSLGREFGFDELLNDRYYRMNTYNKPLVIAELGIAGSGENKNNIINKLRDNRILRERYPLLHSIVLFSDKTESWVPNVVEEPDWRLNREQLIGL